MRGCEIVVLSVYQKTRVIVRLLCYQYTKSTHGCEIFVLSVYHNHAWLWDCCAASTPKPCVVVRLLCCQYTKKHALLWDCCVISIPNPRMAVRFLCYQYTTTTRGCEIFVLLVYQKTRYCEIVVLSVYQIHSWLWDFRVVSIPQPRVVVRLLCCRYTKTTHGCEIYSCQYTKITHGCDIVMLSILYMPMCLSSLNGLKCSG